MSGDLGLNKILGAVLATGLLAVGVHEGASMAFEPEHIEHEKWGMAVEAAVEAGGGGGAAEPLLIDWGTVLPTADVAAGQAVFAKCSSCHKVDATNGTGPGLGNALGRPAASHPGFAYSAAMKEHAAANPQWTYDELDKFLLKPAGAIPGTKMTFVGLKKPEDRIAVIAYLRSLGGSPPIPAPDPSRQPGAAEGAAPAAEGAVAPAAAGEPVATGETAQAGQPVQAPATGPAKAPAEQKSVPGQAGHK